MTLSWNARTAAIAVLLVVTIVGAVAFVLFGVNAGLSEWHDVSMTVVVPGVHPDVATQVQAGDTIYTDPAAMYVGTVEQVDVAPMMKSSPDREGVLRLSEDPLVREVTVVIGTEGRETEELIAIGNQVVQVGQQFSVIGKVYNLRGQITRIDVR